MMTILSIASGIDIVAASNNINIQSDHIRVDRTHHISILNGNVVLKSKYGLLNANIVTIFGNKTKERPNNVVLDIRDDIRVELDSGIIGYIDNVLYDLEGESIFASNARIILEDNSNVLIGNIAKNGDSTYYIKDIMFTGCSLDENDNVFQKYRTISRSTKTSNIIPKSSYMSKISYTKLQNDLKKCMWSLSADEGIYDLTKQRIKVSGVRFRIFNREILRLNAYSTDLSRKEPETGFLFPKPILMGTRQYGIRIPFYWRIAQNKDLLLTATILQDNQMKRRRPIGPTALVNQTLDYQRMKANYLTYHFRHLIDRKYGEDMEYSIIGSFTERTQLIDYNLKSAKVDSNGNIIYGYRHYFNANGSGKISPTTWVSGKLVSVSDPNYAFWYHGLFLPYDRNFAKIQDVKDKSFHKFELTSFTPMILNIEHSTNPSIIPHFVSSISTDRDKLGGYFSFDNQAMYIARNAGYSRASGSTSAMYHLPIKDRFGNSISIDVEARGDIYDMKYRNFDANPIQGNLILNKFGSYGSNFSTWHYGTPGFNGTQMRSMLRSKMMMSHIFVSSNFLGTAILQPMLALILNNRQHASQLIPNEDSFDTRLQYINLFNINKVSGLDAIDSSNYASYGLSYSLFTKYNIGFRASFGQMHRIGKAADYYYIPESSGFWNRKSDYVGSTSIEFGSTFTLSSNFRASPNTKEILELNTTATATLLDNNVLISLTHSKLDKDASIIGRSMNLISGSMGIKLSEKLRLSVSAARNLESEIISIESESKPRWLYKTYSLVYDSGCAEYGIYVIDNQMAIPGVRNNYLIKFSFTLYKI